MDRPYLGLCAIFRNEAPFLAEWIAFHKLVGVDHFYLYDNGSTDQPEQVLRPFLDKGWVTLRPWPIPYHQHAARLAYADCLKQTRDKLRWLACLDIDEFLFAPQHPTLKPILSEFEPYPGVVVRWQVYGSSGHEKRSQAPVISRFLRRAETNWIRNCRVKSIVDPSRVLRPVNSHHFLYHDGALAVTERKEPVELTKKPPLKKQLKPLYRLLGPALTYFDPYAGTDITIRSISVECLRINHYPVKSREEFQDKARFKKEKKRYDGIDYFAYHDRNEVYDPILERYLSDLDGAKETQK
jgi:hypothetical protein